MPTMEAPARHVTKLQYAYSTLRRAIIGCDLAPGERVVIDDLARRFDISSIPVREALRILESEGLVVSIPHVGTTVAPVSRQLIVEVFALLEGLETVSARAAAADGREDLSDLDELVARMDAALTAGKPETWAGLNTQFHLAISGRAGMPMVDQMLRRALDHWERVRRHFFSRMFTSRARAAQREHHTMLQQLRKGDVDGIEKSMRVHNREAMKAYTRYLDR
jgi:DNA-binding GntR family transcriptional regulator